MHIFTKTKTLFYSLFFYVLLLPGNVLADTDSTEKPLVIDPFGPSTIEAILDSVLSALQRFGTSVLVIMIIWTGFLFVSSHGDPGKLKLAKASLIACIVGGAVLLGALGFSQLIKDTFSGI